MGSFRFFGMFMFYFVCKGYHYQKASFTTTFPYSETERIEKRSALSRPIIYYNNTTALQIIILNKRKKNEKEQSLETAKN